MPRGYFRFFSTMRRRRKRRKRSHPYQGAKQACSHKEADERNDSSQGDIKERSSDEDMGDDPILEQKHKIFISHSGRQKLFADVLCQRLEARCHNPFFDRRHDCLPKGKSFPELIVRAAKQCKMLIVVVSDEYFMSKWPMIELNAFVRAQKLSCQPSCIDEGPQILPLFYGLSVSDLGDKSNREKWFDKWETLAKEDPKKRIVVNDWKYALDILRSSNGVVYAKASNNEMAYIREIVSDVCKSIVPDRKWHDSHVHGKSSIRKVICEKMDGVGNSEKFQVKVGGIYGVGGIGKTTICHTLCNELSYKYEGRVCHIEFQSEASKDSKELREKYYKELLQKVLVELSGKSREDMETLDFGKCKDILYKSLSKQRVFLAIDNVWDDWDVKEQAKMYLKAGYHKDSLVMVTSRSKGVLERLGIDGAACLEMPELGKGDAENLFLQHAVGDKQGFGDYDWKVISMCVERCNFSKGAGIGRHYHPLALKVLGLLMGEYGKNPRDWVEHLARVQSFSESSKKNPVFDILRSSFDALPLSLRTLFMDVGFFNPGSRFYGFSTLEWLCDIHKRKVEDIKHELAVLEKRGLLQDGDLASGRVSMHDLYREFGELELRGKLKKFKESGKRRWMYVEDNDMTKVERIPAGGCWEKLTRLAIVAGSFELEEDSEDVDGMECVKGIKWEYFSNVEVLQLDGLDWKWGALNLETMQGLRSLNVCSVRNLYRIEGLEGLENLTHMQWVVDDDDEEMGIHSLTVGQLPPSLKALKIDGSNGELGSDLLSGCRKLSKLELSRFRIETLDLRNCAALDNVVLKAIVTCQGLVLPGADRPSRLRSLRVSYCEDLVHILGIDRLTNLRELRVEWCPKVKVSSLLALTQLQELQLCGEPRLECARDCIPGQLQELVYSGRDAVEKVNLDGFNQLKVLDLSFNPGLTCLEAVGGLPALQHLDLSFNPGLTSLEAVGGLPALRRLRIMGCHSLLRVPDLSKSRHLECLRVSGSKDLVDIPGIDRFTKLRELRVRGWPKLKVPSLLALTQLQELEFCGEGSLERAKDCIPGQLRELRYLGKRAVEEVNLDGFNQLEVLDLFGTCGLTSLEGVGDLPALRYLDLTLCENLVRLPDLSKSRNLKELNLDWCGRVELHERDIEVLSELPLLGPVQVQYFGYSLTLDFVRRKVVISASGGEEQEIDLGHLSTIAVSGMVLQVGAFGKGISGGNCGE